MRNPNRIQHICNRLAALWSKYPDLRLGQLMINFLDGTYKSATYYMEDDDFVEAIEKFYNKGDNK